MNTAQPASLPPGARGSGGISRSTNASTAAPSSGVKNSHGPGRTGVGGEPASGCHGRPPEIRRAQVDDDELKRKVNAELVRSCRRPIRIDASVLIRPAPAGNGRTPARRRGSKLQNYVRAKRYQA